MSSSNRLLLSVLGVVAWSFAAVNSIFAILDAASLSYSHVSFAGLSAASSAFDIISLFCIGLFCVQYAWRRDGIVSQPQRRRTIFALSCIIPTALASILSLVSLGVISSHSRQVSEATARASVSTWANHRGAQWAIWTLTCVLEIALFSSPLWRSKAEKSGQDMVIEESRDSVMSEVRHSHQSNNIHHLAPTQPASPLAALPSPTFSTRSSQSLKSWRDSLQHVVRPVTSRTRLIKQPSFNRDTRSIHSDSQSIDNVSSPDGFDMWEIDSQARDGTMPPMLSRGTVLETIPGSRPASPARALDGPFPATTDGRASPASSLPEPPRMYPDTSRPPSPAISEAHIHPLFRTESPTPAPAATPGTSIIASPLSGQVIACPPRPYSRMRSSSRATSINSRAPSPSPLMHSTSFRDRAISPQGSSSRSPSPPSREMTPPIPDFVLNTSPRNSMSGSNMARKLKLQVDTGR